MILSAKNNCEAFMVDERILHYKDNGITLLKEYIIGAAVWGVVQPGK